ncbi:MAG: DUF4176 domain-containing protein [Lachnospiraceae bacterium]|nr:DUF4176 domain-containing protein [Lachnospiraceae bacterium]
MKKKKIRKVNVNNIVEKGCKMEFLKLGSIILVKENSKKFMIIGRAVNLKTEKGLEYYDYELCTYPEGIMGEDVAFVKHKDVEKVIFEGYEDEEGEEFVNKILPLVEQYREE